MINKKLCVGLLTHCNSQESPERFEILKKAVNSLQNLKRDNTYIYVWDNQSSREVREFLRSVDFFDAIYFSKQNMYDFVAVHKLVQESKKINAKYVCHLEDDFYFYKNDFLDSCFEFLDNNEDCGYLRILKYEYENRDLYNKFLSHPLKDEANCQRHFNQITKMDLIWENVGKLKNYNFYKNNWHWYNYANICRSEIFAKIIPHHDHRPLQSLEGYMMEEYHKLGLKTGVMDEGAVTHLGSFTEKTSQRIKLISNNRKLPVLKYQEILKEIKNCDLHKS